MFRINMISDVRNNPGYDLLIIILFSFYGKIAN